MYLIISSLDSKGNGFSPWIIWTIATLRWWALQAAKQAQFQADSCPGSCTMSGNLQQDK